ncbi:MAG: serine hydrolase [Stygiobacter sp.]|jgi:beta-lactamase class A|uniref:beta-lactamase n=1 Tax=Stygiobacter electus TaxID=3032292 RepID=A0AAE3NXK0_9BACT|nr:serine hydrolase [Stygiobacter electus]MDF1612806.1 class A beta-lactamase-related serine hydrolase [Stygiobacter electus]
MKKHILIFLLMIFSVNKYYSQSLIELDDYINKIKDSVEISLLAQDENGKILYEVNSNKKVPSASIIKIPILISLFEEVEKGNISLQEKYLFTKEDIAREDEESHKNYIDKELTIEFLAKEMIRVSDNSATNILIKRLGFDKINNSIKVKGLALTQLNRLMMDFEAIKFGKQNYTSAFEINKLLLLIKQKKILSTEMNKKFIDFLFLCDDNSTIPKLLPKNVLVAHKTGTLDYLRADAGIIFSRNPIILSIFVEKFRTQEEAEKIIATISNYIYKIFCD